MVGFISGSVGIVAEAIHSAIDLVAAIIAWASVRIADRPPDEDHPFGHGKAESISGAVEAALIVVAAVWIVYEAVHKLFSGGAVDHLPWAIGVMAVSALINTLVSRYLLKVAKEEDSLALEADGQHLATDVYTSLGVALGLSLVWLTGWLWLDAATALAVALWIGFIGWRLVRKATDQLMDAGLPKEDLQRITAILNDCPRIISWHKLRTRKAGSRRHIILHTVFPPDIKLIDAHQVADDLEKRIENAMAPACVVIHQEVDETRESDPGPRLD